MVGIDTNILVRLITADDEDQAARASRLFEEEAVFIPKTVLLETDWVLRSVYGLTSRQSADALKKVAGLPKVVIEDEATVDRALALAADSIDLADALHLASCGGCSSFATFDKQLVRAAGSRSKRIAVFAP